MGDRSAVSRPEKTVPSNPNKVNGWFKPILTTRQVPCPARRCDRGGAIVAMGAAIEPMGAKGQTAMKVTPQADLVRQIVVRTFTDLHPEHEEPAPLVEMILIHDGKYRGRSYRSQGLLAMWLVDIGLLQVYGADGEMLRTINLFEEQGSLRRAA